MADKGALLEHICISYLYISSQVRHVGLLNVLQDFPTTAMTFEAWISSSDFCHAGGVRKSAYDGGLDSWQAAVLHSVIALKHV